jgi:hypothetical protein
MPHYDYPSDYEEDDKNRSRQFTTQISVGFPNDLPECRKIQEWLNVQYAGKPRMDLDEECTQEHKDAFWKLHASRNLTVTFEVDKDGNWFLKEAKL